MGTPFSPHREAVLDAWHAAPDATAVDIARRFGISDGAVESILFRARTAGDVRAAPRRRGRRAGDGRGLLGRGGRPPSPYRDAVLDAWATHLDTPSRLLAAAVGITHRAFDCIVVSARKAGDPRAVTRGRGNRFPRRTA